MNKFVLGALALAASSTPCLAGSDSEWLKLDQDINSLASSLAPQASGATVSGFLRASYASSSDVQGGGGNDLGGFSIDNARLNFTGNVGNYSVFVSVEGSNDPAYGIIGYTGTTGPVGIHEAYAAFPITDQIRGQMGQFRLPFLASSARNEDTLLFIDRTVLGQWYWEHNDAGVQVSGNFEMLNWAIAVANGNDGAGNDLKYSGRVQFTAMGHASEMEGAYGATEETCLTIGFGYMDDDDDLDNAAMCFDATFNMGALSAAAELVDQDKDIGDNTPWNVQAGWMISPDQWEAAVRYEDMDDDDNTTAITAGVNWYHNGHAAKWQFNYSTISSDDTNLEVDVIQVGMTASI